MPFSKETNKKKNHQTEQNTEKLHTECSLFLESVFGKAADVLRIFLNQTSNV